MNVTDLINSLEEIDSPRVPQARRVLETLTATELAELSSTLDGTADIDAAYMRLGEEEGVGLFGVDLIKAGRQAFLRVRTDVQAIVCRSSLVYEFCRRPGLQSSGVAAAILLGVLTDAKLDGVNLALVIFLILRSGLDEFCATSWTNRHDTTL